MNSIAYFAYGSNMLRARLLDRGVLLLDEGQPAQVKDYNLVFNKKSDDGSSKANLMPAPGATSWGVLFSVSSKSLAGLDSAEGAPVHYRRETVTVCTEQGERQAMTYLAQPDKVLPVPDRPWDWYLALILAGGKSYPDIPSDWIKKLRQIGQAKPYIKQPPSKSFTEAVAQLKAAGHARWQDLLIEENEHIL